MFQNLPLDILLGGIIEPLLIHDLPIDTSENPTEGAGSDNQLKRISRNDLALLSLNRAIRSVALPTFWGKNTFYVKPFYKNKKVC